VTGIDPSLYSTLRRMVVAEDHKFVVSFGGGSVPGIASNIALAQVIEDLGLREHVDEIWGTSAGAVVGGGWASGSSASRIYAGVRELNRRGTVDVRWLSLLRLVLMLPFGVRMPDGFVRGRHFQNAMRRGLSVSTFEECPTPFRCIAVTADGEARRKVFRTGELLPAMFASMSLPGVMLPMKGFGENGGFLDGGLLEKTPLFSPIHEHRASGDPRRLVLLCTHHGGGSRGRPPRGFFERFIHSIDVLDDVAWGHQVEEARAAKDVILIVVDPHLTNVESLDFASVERHFTHARESFGDKLQNANLVAAFGGR
jgi:predicted acylesterase/phospholipase RssA